MRRTPPPRGTSRSRTAVVVVTAAVILLAGFGVVVQQYDVWASADLERNVDEFVPEDTLESCMDEVDGVWLPWLVTEARDMCSEATGDD